VSFWFKYEDSPNSTAEIFALLSTLNTSIRLDRDEIHLINNSSTNSGGSISFDFTQYQGEWKHYAISLSSSVVNGDGFNFYVDGEDTTLSGTGSLNFDPPNLDNLYIGGIWIRSISGSYDEDMVYPLDQLKIYHLIVMQ
jgi:hypothetical protein